MPYEIIWSVAAVNRASAYLADDIPGLRALMDNVDQLAKQPRLPLAYPMGSGHIFRLVVGHYQLLYEINDHDSTVSIVHVGRVV